MEMLSSVSRSDTDGQTDKRTEKAKLRGALREDLQARKEIKLLH
jgi:hypothetical protein